MPQSSMHRAEQNSRRGRRWIFAFAGLVIATMIGCLGSVEQTSDTSTTPTGGNGDDPMRDRLDHVLTFTLHDRYLTIEDHAAWQILHGALAYQLDFPVMHEGTLKSAVGHMLDGGSINGWLVRPGKVIDEEKDRRGLIAVMQPGSKAGQGHHDQWLAILAQCGLDRTQPIKYEGRTYTIDDFVEQVKWDVPRNVEQEFSWTLIGLTAYEGTDATWTASDGQEWSIERLLESEVTFQIGEGACGGTHRLIGITMTLNLYKESGRELEGVWLKADRVVREAVELARIHQNADGTFSTNYVTIPGSSPDLAQNLGSTGHVLEFLAIALPKDKLDDEWVRLAADSLCQIFEMTRDVPLECGALYHAAHGLVLYREKLYGKTNYADAIVPEDGEEDEAP